MRNKVFNTPFENMLRVLLLINTVDQPVNVDRIAALDFICIFGKKCRILDKNLHGDNEFGFSEFTSKRERITEAIKLAVKNDFLKIENTEEGFLYSISPRGKEVVEKKFSYKNLSMEEIIHHLAFFVSRLWQIHVFGEGNTRTTAVFFIKYLRTLGFDATNDIFAENAWYFRNALVRANYNDLKNGVHETTEYLELFLRNLLLDEKNELHNRTMHISGRFAEVDIERVKVDIKSGEVDIESTKVDIRNKLLSFSDTISEKTINHTVEIFSKCGKENCFGRTIVEEITGLKPSRASKLIKLLVDSEVIVPVTGHGKGKYRFQ